jgi:tyrosyl-tRNA synthetase
MFGKTMSVPDEAMGEWFMLAAGRRDDEAAAIIREVHDGTRHPGQTKRLLAREVVTLYWGAEAATSAEQAFDRLFRDKSVPDDVPIIALSDDGASVSLAVVLQDADLVASRSEARRLIGQGAVRVGGQPIEHEFVEVSELIGNVIQVGKRRFVRIEREAAT